jgi:hypothetical protein
MAYIDQAATAASPGFQARVLVSMVKAAIALDTSTNPLAKALSNRVMNDPVGYLLRFSYAVAFNLAADTSTSVTDAQIDTSVAGIWPAIAGT